MVSSKWFYLKLGKRKYLYNNKLCLSILFCIDAILSLLPLKKRQVPTSIKKILLINPGQLGDILLSTTILPILQRQFPDTSIDMICREGAASILDGNPFIRKMYFLEHVMAWRRKDKKRSFLTFLKECSKVRALCKKEKYDACLLLRPYGGNLILLGRWLAPRVLIGYSTAGFGALLDISIAWKEGVHATEHLLELLKPLGIFEDRSHLTYLIYPSADDRHYVNKVLENYDLTKFVVVHPFAGDQNKTLPLSFWRQLFQQESRPILITEARQEAFPVEQIENKQK